MSATGPDAAGGASASDSTQRSAQESTQRSARESEQRSAPDSAQGSTQGTVRRLIVFTLLFALVSITATGVAGLLARLFETRPEFGTGPAGLALSLAFTLVGGPLAVLLWWFPWRRLEGPDRSSIAWGLYLAAICTVSLIVFTVSVLGALSDLVGGRWSPDALATGIAWAAVWVVHRLMWAHPAKGPLRLTSVPTVLGAVYGLIVAAVGAIAALTALFDAALRVGDVQVGEPWWRAALQALVWCAGGALVLGWHWVRDAVDRLRGGFADVMLVLVGVLAPVAVMLGGLGTALHVGLRAAFDRTEPWAAVSEPLGLALAAAAVGALVWLAHRRAVAARGEVTRTAARLVRAGIGLVGAASGVGVIVNALLASLSPPLAGDDTRSLLLAGVASLTVGAPVWWAAWVPGRAPADPGSAGRRVYLVAVFGVSAVVAIIALLVVGYRIFEFVLGEAEGSLVERVRAPFGLLVATAIVASYHFVVWRRDRRAAPAVTRARTIDRVILVAAGDTATVAEAIAHATGASVTRWSRAGGGEAPPADAVVEALTGIQARRVLVVVAPDGRAEVVPLQD